MQSTKLDLLVLRRGRLLQELLLGSISCFFVDLVLLQLPTAAVQKPRYSIGEQGRVCAALAFSEGC